MRKKLKKLAVVSVLALTIFGSNSSIFGLNELSIVSAEESQFLNLNAEGTILYKLEGTSLIISAKEEGAECNSSIALELKEKGVDISKITKISFDKKIVFTTFQSMFEGMEKLKSINWDNVYPKTEVIGSNGQDIEVTTVTDYSRMFFNCKSLEGIDLTQILGGTYLNSTVVSNRYKSWQRNFLNAFYGCEKLTYVNFCDTDLAYMLSCSFRNCYMDRYSNSSFNNDVVFSFGDNDNRNFFYDWTAYSRTGNTTKITTYATRQPITFKLIYSIPKTTPAGVGMCQQVKSFTIEDKSVDLTIENADNYDELDGFKLITNKHPYNTLTFSEELEGVFTSLNPSTLLTSFITEKEGEKTLDVVSITPDDRYGTSCEIRDLIEAVPAEPSYIISFMSGTLGDFKPIKVKKGQPITELPVPEIEGEGYFSGWSTEDGTIVESGFVPTSDLVLYPTALVPATEITTQEETEQKTTQETPKTDSQVSQSTAQPIQSTQSETPIKTEVVNSTENSDTVKTLKKIKSVKVKIKGKKALISWEKIGDSKEYEVQLAKDKKMKKKAKLYKSKGITKTLKLKKGTYFVRVRALNDTTKASWSKVKKFKIK